MAGGAACVVEVAGGAACVVEAAGGLAVVLATAGAVAMLVCRVVVCVDVVLVEVVPVLAGAWRAAARVGAATEVPVADRALPGRWIATSAVSAPVNASEPAMSRRVHCDRRRNPASRTEESN